MMGSKLMLEQLSEKAIICRRHHKDQGTFKARQRKGFYLWRCLAIMYKLMKVPKSDTPSCYQHCLMANDNKGANWFSKDRVIKKNIFMKTLNINRFFAVVISILAITCHKMNDVSDAIARDVVEKPFSNPISTPATMDATNATFAAKSSSVILGGIGVDAFGASILRPTKEADKILF